MSERDGYNVKCFMFVRFWWYNVRQIENIVYQHQYIIDCELTTANFRPQQTSDKRTIVRVGTCKIEAILLRAIGQSRLLIGPLIAMNNWKINCQLSNTNGYLSKGVHF